MRHGSECSVIIPWTWGKHGSSMGIIEDWVALVYVEDGYGMGLGV